MTTQTTNITLTCCIFYSFLFTNINEVLKTPCVFFVVICLNYFIKTISTMNQDKVVKTYSFTNSGPNNVLQHCRMNIKEYD